MILFIIQGRRKYKECSSWLTSKKLLTVSWDFLFNMLDFFNFGSGFKNGSKVFYTSKQSCVTGDGHLSKWFNLQRGCRQGDLLSPNLFIICKEIMAILIRNNCNIKGIKMCDNEFLISRFADNTSIILDGTHKSLRNCMIILKLHAEFSGLDINLEKKVVWIRSENIAVDYNLH